MKLAKLAYLLTVGALLPLAVVGCRKGLDKTTQIPGHRQGSLTDTPTGPRDPGAGNVLPGGTGTDGTSGVIPANTDIPASSRTFSDWIENRTEFAAQTVLFDFDKSVIKASEIGKLEEVASRMKSSFQGKALRIEGHCDERGTEEYNRALGDKRALSIREKLVQLGLDPEMLPTISFGEDKPADTGHTDAAFAKNRRGELILLSPPGSN
jgi:peptidoglycan-associated lipoprotein